MDTGFGTNQLYSACRLTVTHHFADSGLECKPIEGTGFLVEFPSPDTRIGLVTNRHLTDATFANEIENRGATLKSIKVQWWQSKYLLLEHTVADPQPLYYDSDPLVDVAVIPIAAKTGAPVEIIGTLHGDVEKFMAENSPDGIMFNHAHSWAYLLECERLWPELEPGEFVTFPGYPIWYDRLQTRPVLRSGVIASDPQQNHRYCEGEPTTIDGNHQVLFDAFSTNGNSGGPVYVAQRGMAPIDLRIPMDDGAIVSQGKMIMEGYRRSFLVGINASHCNDTGLPRPNEHAGLSRMHKLSVLVHILRANEAPPDPDARAIKLLIPVPDR